MLLSKPRMCRKSMEAQRCKRYTETYKFQLHVVWQSQDKMLNRDGIQLMTSHIDRSLTGRLYTNKELVWNFSNSDHMESPKLPSELAPWLPEELQVCRVRRMIETHRPFWCVRCKLVWCEVKEKGISLFLGDEYEFEEDLHSWRRSYRC